MIGTDNGAAAPLDADNGSVAAVAAKLLPSTVQIQAKGGADGTTKGGATGSGFVLDRARTTSSPTTTWSPTPPDDGQLKVVDQNGNKHAAKIVGRSPVYDIAVLDVTDGDRPAAGRDRLLARRCASATRSSRSARRSG